MIYCWTPEKGFNKYFVNIIIFSFYFMHKSKQYAAMKIHIWAIITLLVIQDVNRGENEQHLQERNSIY